MPDGNQTGGHDVRVVPDLVFAAPDGKPLLADLYLPANPETTPPVILWLHGGAWHPISNASLPPVVSQWHRSNIG